MLLNTSYNQPLTQKKIKQEVGKPFTLLERFKLKGSHSPSLHITSVSLEIHNLLVLDQNPNLCHIEMRPQGILVNFRAVLGTYTLVIPYYKLNLYKGKSQEYSIYRDHYFIKVKAEDPAVHQFMKKVLDYKLGNAPTQVEDLL